MHELICTRSVGRMPENVTAEQRFSYVASAVSEWMDRTTGERPVAVPEPGSSLAGDDRLYPAFTVSLAVWHGLITATEHLDFFCNSFNAMKVTYPSAYFTVLRSALLGSSQAIWNLSPSSRPDRQKRTLIIASTDAGEERRLVSSMPMDVQVRNREIQRLETRVAEIDAAAQELGYPAGTSKKWKVNATEVVIEAARTALDNDMQEYAELLWRKTSGHVHGHAYSRVHQLDRNSMVRGPKGSNWARASASPEEVMTVLYATFLLTQSAWAIYDERRVCHQTPTCSP